MENNNITSAEHLDTNYCEQDMFDNTSVILDDHILSNSNTGNQLSGYPTAIKSGGTDTLQRLFRRKQQTAGASPMSLKIEEKPQPSDGLISEEQGNIGDNLILENLCDTTVKKLSMESGGETDRTAGTAAAAAINSENVQKTSSLNRIFNRRSSVTMSDKSDKNDKKKQNKRRPQTSNSENDSSTQQKSRFRNYLNYYWTLLFRKGVPKTLATDMDSTDSAKINDEIQKAGENIFENNNESPVDILEINLPNEATALSLAATLLIHQ